MDDGTHWSDPHTVIGQWTCWCMVIEDMMMPWGVAGSRLTGLIAMPGMR